MTKKMPWSVGWLSNECLARRTVRRNVLSVGGANKGGYGPRRKDWCTVGRCANLDFGGRVVKKAVEAVGPGGWRAGDPPGRYRTAEEYR